MILAAVLLGLLQGLTEFLPVSSSGHLVLLRHSGLLPPVWEKAFLFDVVLHLGSLMAVVFYFGRFLLDLLGRRRKLLLLLVLGTLPAALFGLAAHDLAEELFQSPARVAAAMLVTGVVLAAAHRLNPGRAALEEAGAGAALGAGLLQALAIIPGVSRSGLTIAGGLCGGLKREAAVDFSFLLALPAVAGAAVFALAGGGAPPPPLPPEAYAAGLAAAFLSSLLAIRLLLAAVRRFGLKPFAFYLFLAGGALLAAAA